MIYLAKVAAAAAAAAPQKIHKRPNTKTRENR
jgi:hypothetical protein